MVIKRVSPMSAAKIGGILGVLVGLAIGACISLVMMAASSMITMAAKPEDGTPGAIVGMIFGAGAIVVVPIVYGTMSFIMGALYAALYNVAAKWMGGLEIEVA